MKRIFAAGMSLLMILLAAGCARKPSGTVYVEVSEPPAYEGREEEAETTTASADENGVTSLTWGTYMLDMDGDGKDETVRLEYNRNGDEAYDNVCIEVEKNGEKSGTCIDPAYPSDPLDLAFMEDRSIRISVAQYEGGEASCIFIYWENGEFTFMSSTSNHTP